MTVYNIQLDLTVEDFDKEDVGGVLDAIKCWGLGYGR